MEKIKSRALRTFDLTGRRELVGVKTSPFELDRSTFNQLHARGLVEMVEGKHNSKAEEGQKLMDAAEAEKPKRRRTKEPDPE